MHTIAKIKGVVGDNGKWHFVDESPFSLGSRTLCDGLAIDDGDIDVVFKRVERLGVTCPKCIETLKYFKSLNI